MSSYLAVCEQGKCGGGGERSLRAGITVASHWTYGLLKRAGSYKCAKLSAVRRVCEYQWIWILFQNNFFAAVMLKEQEHSRDWWLSSSSGAPDLSHFCSAALRSSSSQRGYRTCRLSRDDPRVGQNVLLVSLTSREQNVL